MTTIYRVFDDEWEAIYGLGQLIKFTEEQVLNCQDDYLEENLTNIYTTEVVQNILALVNKILTGGHITEVQQAITLLNVRCFEVEEIEVY